MGKRHSAREVVAKPRQVAVLCGQGKALADAICAIRVTDAAYYRWRNEYGGLKED